MANQPWSVDLHSHTLYSDGSQAPADLVRLARTNGVRTLAVTDHDHTGGIDEALSAGLQAGIEIIPGIELSVSHAEFDDIHLLAYYFAWHHPALLDRLEAFRVARDTRAERILERINDKLASEGRQPIAFAAVKARVQGAFGRPHIATALIERGYASDMQAAFREYLIPCNVPKYYMPAAEAMALIQQTRGLSSLAHPKFITPDRRRLRSVICELRELGLDGIEAYHGDHGAEERLYCIRLANQLGMIVTGGSDYHGFKASAMHADGGKLGSLQLPYGMAVRLRRAYLTRYPVALLLCQWPRAAAAAMRRALQTHYQLTSLELPPAVSLPQELLGSSRPARSQVLDLPSADARLREGVMAAGQARGVRLVEVPWETDNGAEPDGLQRLPEVSAQRFQHTSIEHLAHELVHQAIVRQLEA
jgi:predicted metal-dependent phosphoesterase TrpH